MHPIARTHDRTALRERRTLTDRAGVCACVRACVRACVCVRCGLLQAMEETAEERGKYRCTADEMAIILEATGLGPSAPFSPADPGGPFLQSV